MLLPLIKHYRFTGKLEDVVHHRHSVTIAPDYDRYAVQRHITGKEKQEVA